MVERLEGGRMKEIEFDELLKIAESYYKDKTPWHFHVLMDKCMLNTEKPKFLIVLENEKSGEFFVSKFDSNPRKFAEKLEPLFYRRI